MEDSYEKLFDDKQRVMIVLAHPDDMEIVCGGTAARLSADGKEVLSVVTTDGQKGMHDSDQYTLEQFAQIRKISQINAGIELGLKKDNIINLGIRDGEVEASIENIEKVVRKIREFKPDIIITHNPTEIVNRFDEETSWINHRDHRHTGEITFDAAYPYCRDRGFFPDHFESGLSSHEVSQFLISDSYMDKNAVSFDISKFIETKRSALKCHMDGGVLSHEEVNGFIEENRRGDKYFEILGYLSF